MIIGLTGQTGAGKSTVCEILNKSGFYIIDCDKTAKKCREDKTVIEKLTEAFGLDILFCGEVVPSRLAKKAFSSAENTEKLNAITHPIIEKMIFAEAEKALCNGFEFIVLDAPTLIESGIYRRCDFICSVMAPEDIRKSRVLSRDNITSEELEKRMSAQKGDSYYTDKSDFIIRNYPPYDYKEQTAEMINIIRKKAQNMEEKTEIQELKEKLFRKNEHISYILSPEEQKTCDEFCEGYKNFISYAKMEREAVEFAVAQAEKRGFVPFDKKAVYKAGDKVYLNNRGKAIILCVFGTENEENGIRIAAAHVDSPRLDLKPNPVYESDELALFKTHYYGGIKKYQWTAIPLALHGAVVLKNGEKIKVNIGENDDDVQFVVTDLLPHLAKDQVKETLAQGIKGEDLNILIGSRPFKGDKESEGVKLNVLSILFEKYGITEEDFQSAELCALPAFKPRDIGLDRSMIGAYGHDDKVCAYPEMQAIFDVGTPKYTSMCIFADKEEVGSDGNTGMNSAFLRYFIEDIGAMRGIAGRDIMSKSMCLSADVNAAYDPNYPSVMEKNNASYLNHGAVITKYTGARGKSGTSDAGAELMAKIRKLLDDSGVAWQTGELGKVDQGGGGTVAMYIANLDIDTVDLGVPVLSMHAPFEVVAKFDVYMTYKACLAFFTDKN